MAADCQGRTCGTDACGNACGQGCAFPHTCTAQGQCACPALTTTCGSQCCSAGQVCSVNGCCTPNCTGKNCGDDGCGGSCGSCNLGICVACSMTLLYFQQECRNGACGYCADPGDGASFCLANCPSRTCGATGFSACNDNQGCL